MHKFINKISQSSMGEIFNKRTHNEKSCSTNKGHHKFLIQIRSIEWNRI